MSDGWFYTIWAILMVCCLAALLHDDRDYMGEAIKHGYAVEIGDKFYWKHEIAEKSDFLMKTLMEHQQKKLIEKMERR